VSYCISTAPQHTAAQCTAPHQETKSATTTTIIIIIIIIIQ
jgi:hypothetical protein